MLMYHPATYRNVIWHVVRIY